VAAGCALDLADPPIASIATDKAAVNATSSRTFFMRPIVRRLRIEPPGD
jgi:hypothetical protein